MSAATVTAAAVTTRPMRWWDIDPVLRLERDLFGAEGWSAALFWSELAQADTRRYVVAETDGALIGYAGLAAFPDEAFVQTIAVARSWWGRGPARTLLELLLAEAGRRGLRTVGLEVRADNPRAQALYRRYGFERIALRRGYYQPSGTDAVIMQRRQS